MAGNKSNPAASKVLKSPEFAALLKRHMDAGTGQHEAMGCLPWKAEELAKKIQMSGRAIEKYLKRESIPSVTSFHALVVDGFEVSRWHLVDGIWRTPRAYRELFEAAYPGRELPEYKPDSEPLPPAPAIEAEPTPIQARVGQATAVAQPPIRSADSFKTFPKLAAPLAQRAQQVEEAIHQLLVQSGKDTPLRQALDLLLSRWGDHENDPDDSREFTIVKDPVDAYPLITSLAAAIESCNTDHWQQRGAPAELAALRRWVERIAKLTFALGWTEVAWSKFGIPAFEKQIHDICDGDLFYAGHNAALGRDFELPHSTLIDKWRVKIDPAIDPVILRDLEMNIYDKAANHFGVSSRPIFESGRGAADYKTRLAQWQRKVAIRVKVMSDMKRRSVSLTARLAGADVEPKISELEKYAQAIHSDLHTWSGRPGSYFCCDDDLFLDALYVLQQQIQQIP